MDIGKLVLEKKSMWVDYPDLDGFRIELETISRQQLIKLRKKCTTTKFDRKTHQAIEELDDDLFLQVFSDAIIKNWEGLTLEHLSKLMLIEYSEHDLDKEVEYNKENALSLFKYSNEFDNFINNIIFDVEKFSDLKGKNSIKPSKSS